MVLTKLLCASAGELYALLMAQPRKRLPEAHMRFYAAEVLLALQYLHLLGYIYRWGGAAALYPISYTYVAYVLL